MAFHGFNRRQFLSTVGGALALPANTWAAPATPAAPADFSFLFLTDAHLQPELDAIHGTSLAMTLGRSEKADFAIQGGDHVFDAEAVTKVRALALFDQYGKTEQDLGLKVHHTIGNHDVFGIFQGSGIDKADPAYGKKMYTERFGPTYYSYDHKGCHFIILDSIGTPAGGGYEARIDDDQVAWLKKDLAALTPGTPVIVTTHIPLVTAFPMYTEANLPYGFQGFINGPAVIAELTKHNVLGVFQGHTHVNETVLWKGIPFMTCGAICGNWWKGTRLGTPEGLTVATVSRGKLTTRYVPTGFKTIAPENT